MKLSIRTRITLLISLVYLSVFVFLIAAGALALYLGLQEQIDNELTDEKRWVVNLLETEFSGLRNGGEETRKELAGKFIEELNEVYLHKNQLVIFSIESDSGNILYSVESAVNVIRSLPAGILSRKEGFYGFNLKDSRYRALIVKQDWVTLFIAAENQTFFEVMDEFREILAAGVPVTLLIVLLGGGLLAKLVMKPVVRAAEATKEITLTNLEQRLPPYKGNDEFGVLVETLNQMISRLNEGVTRIQQFTQDAAHELRTPLTFIRGELELLYQKQHKPDELEPILEKVLDRTIVLSKIVDDLMMLAQSDAGKYPVEERKFDLSLVLENIVEDTRVMVEGCPITVNILKNEHVQFWGDEQLIRRLLLNLAGNAAKFTKKGEISFSLENKGDRTLIIISDTGIGIPKQDLPNIFERFYRLDKARDTAGGSGLGLAICKWIVTAHNGTITAESQDKGGTTFFISFSQTD